MKCKIIFLATLGLALSTSLGFSEGWPGPGMGNNDAKQNVQEQSNQQPQQTQESFNNIENKKEEEFHIEQVYPSPYVQYPPPVPSRQDMFRRDMNDLYGLTPNEIIQLRKEWEARQKAATDAPAELKCVTIPISLASGMKMPTIQVTPGYVSSIVLLDRFGNPWPVKGVSWGDKEAFQVESPSGDTNKNATGIPQNIISVSPLRSIGATSMSILLEDKSIPVVLRLVINKAVNDARADLKIDGLAPGAAPEMRASTIPAQFATTDMIAFLDGVPPKSATRLMVNSELIEAWSYAGSMIVRTRTDLVSPSWQGIEHGADHLKVYKTSMVPVILVLDHGETNMVTVTLPETNVFDAK